MSQRIQLRRDTAANWTSADPTLAVGEVGYETDTNKLKIGDGSTAWVSLGYCAGIDSSAIHDDVAAEISAVTEKVTPVSADVLLIEDSAAANAKKRVQVGNLPGGAHDLGGSEHIADTLADLNSKVSDATLDDSASSRPPSGIAGGDLAGTYPNPTIPAPAQFLCNATRSNTLSIPNSAFTYVTLNAEVFDVGGMHDLVTNTSRITIPTGGDGTYLILGMVTFDSDATGYRRLQIRKNGVTVANERKNAVLGSATALNVQMLEQMVAGDYAQMRVYQNSGGAINLFSGQEDISFSAHKVA